MTLKRFVLGSFFLFVGLFNLNAKLLEYDVLAYRIHLKVLPENKHILGSNTIEFAVVKPGDAFGFKLSPLLSIDKIMMGDRNLNFVRDSHQVFVSLVAGLEKGAKSQLTIYYGGTPLVAKKAPWDGGFVWGEDSLGNPWVGLACEGIGAATWLPCKDTWDDEPEQVTLKLEVPNGLVGVSNGRLVQTEKGYTTTTYTWETKNPINHYGITINVGAYVHFNDAFVSDYNDTLDLDYYVLSYNENMARTHFQQSKRMLQAFESYFGKYPFYEDGYKLVETPYWGMEHQSCVAYGNNYENNRFGFDFIIIHESGHEWFANSITAKDKADMWIHESFTTYSEALYVEKIFGNPRAIQYLMVQKEKIKNDAPMIGVYGTNHKFNDNDIYYKGSWILHTLRSMIDNDTMWFNTLKDLNTHFYHQTVTTKQVEAFLSKRTRLNLGPFFEQYLRHKELPVLEYFILNKDGLNELHYRLKSKVSTLEMPIKVTLAKEFYDYVYAQTKWRVIDLPYEDASHFKIDVQHFLVNLERVAPR